MVSNIINPGNKIDIRILSQVESADRLDEAPHIYKSQILDIRDDGDLEIMMPSEGGKIILLPLGIRYELVFYTDNGLYKCVGQVKERYKSENKYMLLITFNTQLSKFQRREYYRLQCIMDATYYSITKEMAMMDTTQGILTVIKDTPGYTENEKTASVLDISGGGVRFIADESSEEGSYILMFVCLGKDAYALEYPIVGHVIHCDRVNNESNKFEHRVEFILKDSKVREEIIRYIFAEERKNRKNGKG